MAGKYRRGYLQLSFEEIIKKPNAVEFPAFGFFIDKERIKNYALKSMMYQELSGVSSRHCDARKRWNLAP